MTHEIIYRSTSSANQPKMVSLFPWYAFGVLDRRVLHTSDFSEPLQALPSYPLTHIESIGVKGSVQKWWHLFMPPESQQCKCAAGNCHTSAFLNCSATKTSPCSSHIGHSSCWRAPACSRLALAVGLSRRKTHRAAAAVCAARGPGFPHATLRSGGITQPCSGAACVAISLLVIAENFRNRLAEV